ncbi:MAG: FAD-dependent monooxygenase [Sneathiella sp.]|nr:FAD-dependent monooxygenase [Sneathiella sp.]
MLEQQLRIGTSMATAKKPATINTDILVVGGSLNGLPLAIAVASAGLDVIVLERVDPAAVVADTFDGRVSAIAYASRNLFKGIGVWDHIPEKEPMLDIRITDGPS